MELLDYRPLKPKDEVLTTPSAQRVVLRPTPETIYADIRRMSERSGRVWSDAEALAVEARIILWEHTILRYLMAYSSHPRWRQHPHYAWTQIRTLHEW